MAPVTPALLDEARHLVIRPRFDVEETLLLLTNLPTDGLDLQTRGAVKHALIIAAAGDRITDSRHTAVARFALARVVALLERHLEAAVPDA